MVHAKNRLFNSLILIWRRNNDSVEFGAAICGLGFLMIILIFVMTYDCLKKACCPRSLPRKESRNNTEYAK